MQKQKIYIAGCGGMLGTSFYEVFGSNYELKCTDIDVNESWLSPMDFRSYSDYFKDVSSFRPDYLFHLGAHTDLEYCELNPDDAYLTNTIGAVNAAHISKALNIPLLYISTAGLFDGAQELYDDDDAPNPSSHYARSKYVAEVYIKEYLDEYLICRAGWMMGGGPKKDKKFINKLMLQLKAGKKDLYVVDDKLGTPTYTHDFAKNVEVLLSGKHWGLFNMVCQGLTGRLEVAKELVSILGLENDVVIHAVDSNYWSKEYFADRPPSERLINRKLEELGLDVMRDWKVCLKEYIQVAYLK